MSQPVPTVSPSCPPACSQVLHVLSCMKVECRGLSTPPHDAVPDAELCFGLLLPHHTALFTVFPAQEKNTVSRVQIPHR